MTLPTTTTVTHPEALGYGARLGKLLLRLAVGPGRAARVLTAELQPPRFQTEAHPEEILSSFGDVYSLADATGGEGLFNRYRARGGEGDATRFWASEGIDVSPSEEGRPEEVRLLGTTAVIDALAADPVRIALAGSVLWATNGQSLRKTVDVTATTPVFAADDPHAGEPAVGARDVTALGNIPYVALGTNGIHRNSGSWAHWSDVAAVRVWSALDRIVASTGTALYEASAGATSVLLYTLPSGGSWNDVTSASGAVLACATTGYVYAFSLDSSATLKIAAQTRMEGETPVAVASRGGTVWVATQDGTTARLWETPLTDALGFGALQLVREWEGTVDFLTATRDRVLIGVHETGQPAHVWRLELETSGLSKGQRLADGDVSGLLTSDGLVVAGVAGQGVYRENPATLASTGHLIGPFVDFFRAEDKSWVTGWADVTVEAGQRVELWFTAEREAMFDPDHPSWTRLRSYTSSTEGVEVGLGDVVARALVGMVKLHRGTSATSPKVRGFSFRAYPTGGDVVIELPVDVGDQVERFGRRRTVVPGWGQQVYEALRGLEGQAIECELYRTGDVVRGLVESVATPISAITPFGSATQVSTVTVRGRRVDEPDDIGSGGWLGGFAMGGLPMGGSKEAA